MKSQRILILTDLHWSHFSKEISSKDVISLKIKNEIPSNKKFSTIKEYVEIIDNHNPTLILFGGDITGDGSCGTGYHNAFLYLLHYIEHRKIKSVYIKGNHDLDLYYNKLIKKSLELKQTHEVSGKFLKINGLRILGLSFDDTNNKNRLLNLIARNKKKIDIVLAHSELARRPWLFDFETKYIITGHYDIKFNSINNKIFLSFFNDSPSRSYATIEFENKKELITYYFEPAYTTNGKAASEIVIQGKLEKNKFSFITKRTETAIKFFNKRYYNDIIGEEFKNGIEQLLKIKKHLKTNSTKLTKPQLKGLMKFHVNGFMKISKALIADYIGKAQVEK